MNIKYTDDLLKEAVLNSKSWKEVCKYLNPNSKLSGSMQSHLKKRSLELLIDISHFKGIAWSKDLVLINRKIPIEDYLSNKRKIKSHYLRIRLIEDGYLTNECFICKISKWQDKPISLHLDHIDGHHNNNSLENLRILCPNCHSQTETYDNKKVLYNLKDKNKCIDCSINISFNSKRCGNCYNVKRSNK